MNTKQELCRWLILITTIRLHNASIMSSATSFGLRCNPNCVDKSCSTKDGTCIKGCIPGWQGAKCEMECNVNCLQRSCDQDTGACFDGCKVGWYGPTCERICSKTCARDTCEFASGNCKHGCDEGFEGQNCQKRVAIREKISSHLIYIMIAGVTTLLVIIGVAVVCCLYKRSNENIRTWCRSICKCRLDREDVSVTGPNMDYMELDLTARHDDDAYGLLELKTRIAAGDVLRTVIDTSPDRINQEFSRLWTAVSKQCNVAKRPENISKNNFNDVFPYDENRVILRALDGLEDTQHGSDYINASYIRGRKERRQYIAVQGPTGETVRDFWQMVWQEGCYIIVMLNHLTEETKDAFMPDKITVTKVGTLRIKCARRLHYADFTLHEFKLSLSGENRLVRHLQYNRWLDEGVLPSALDLIEFYNKYRTIQMEYSPVGPVIVHCTSGVGLTGVFIALDFARENFMATGECDVFKTVQLLREQRVQMVYLISHYKLLYEVVAHEVAFGCILTSKTELKTIFDRLQIVDTCRKSYLQQSFEDCSSSVLMDRRTTRTVGQNNRQVDDVYEKMHLNNKQDSQTELYEILDVSPFNLTVVDSYYHQDAIATTRMPSPDTIADFCQFIITKRCSTIVMLNAVDKKDHSILQYWTDGKVYGHIKVSSQMVQKCSNYVIRNVVFEERTKHKSLGPPKSHKLRLIQYKAWDFRVSVVPNVSSFLNLLMLVNRQTTRNLDTPLLVHCMDGSGQCALFCAMYNLIENVKHENFINVALTVCKVKARLPAGVNTLEQYKFCYYALIAYLHDEGVICANELTYEETGFGC